MHKRTVLLNFAVLKEIWLSFIFIILRNFLLETRSRNFGEREALEYKSAKIRSSSFSRQNEAHFTVFGTFFGFGQFQTN